MDGENINQRPWEAIKGMIFIIKTYTFIKFDSMEALVSLGRQIEAEVTSLCVGWSLRNLGEKGRRQIIESSTRLAEFGGGDLVLFTG